MIVASLLAASAVIAPCKPVAYPAVPATIVWRDPSAASDSVLVDGTLVMQTKTHLRALDAVSGRVRWETLVARGGSEWKTDLVVSGGRLFVNRGEELLIVAVSDGRDLARVRTPRWFQLLKGPPLIAVSRNEPVLGSTLYALDEDGSVRAKRMVRRVDALWVIGDTVVAKLGRNSELDGPEPHLVSAFRSQDLTPLWSFGAGGADLQEIGGRWYIGDTPWSDMRPLDLATGKLGPPLPRKEPTEVTWGGATWEIEIVTSSAERQPECERLRVNDPATGRPRFTIDLPFSAIAFLRDGERFYAAGSGYVARLNWRTGAIERLWSGLPMLQEVYIVRGLLIGVAFSEGAVAIRLD